MPWLAASIVGCVHEPVRAWCPEVTPAALAITEVHGPGDGPDAPWIEVQSSATEAIDLIGARLRVRRPDGGAEQLALIRRSVVVAPAGLVVLSAALDDARPPFAAVGVGRELRWPWFAAAVLQLESCEVLVDRTSHPPLPKGASYALAPGAGRSELAADRNDRATEWCAALASPGAENPPCR
jgi:hypothetical protein